MTTRRKRGLGAAIRAGWPLLSLSLFASSATAQPESSLVPSRCVAGTLQPQPEESLDTITTAPPPSLRSNEITSNLEHPHAEGELLVFPSESGAALIAQNAQWLNLFDSIGGQVVRFAPGIPFYRVRFAPSSRLHEKVSALIAYPQVRLVQANGCVFPAQGQTTTPNDPEFVNDQWSLKPPFLRMSEAWAIESGDAQVVVAIIDSAFQHTNSDLDERQWFNVCEDLNGNGFADDSNHASDACPGEPADVPADDFHGWNFFHGNDVLDDAMNHGTMVSGIVAAEPNNGQWIAGINFDVRLMDLKVYHTLIGYFDGVLLAFDYAIRHGAKVINASWTLDAYYPDLERKIQEADAAGIVVVAAAGDDGAGADLDVYVEYPCSFTEPNVACVAATSKLDTLLYGSNFGVNSVHLGAPGEDIQSTMGSSTGSNSGTSLATAQASGVAALLKAKCPDASASWVVERLRSGPSIAGLKTMDGRRLDAFAALSSECPAFEVLPAMRRWSHDLRPLLPPWWKTTPRWPPIPPPPVPPHGPEPDPPPPIH